MAGPRPRRRDHRRGDGRAVRRRCARASGGATRSPPWSPCTAPHRETTTLPAEAAVLCSHGRPPGGWRWCIGPRPGRPAVLAACARRPARPRSATWPTTGWPPPRSSPSRWGGRCSSRVTPGSARPPSRSGLADVLEAPLVRLQCYEGLDASQALYDWDFPRQLLHLRVAETAGVDDPAALEHELYDRRFLLARPILPRAGDHAARCCSSTRWTGPTTSSRRSCSRCSATSRSRSRSSARSGPRVPPVVVLTSNRTREVHDALKRRCLYHWLDHPSYEREVAVIRRRLPGGERATRRRRGRRRPAAARRWTW